MPEYVKNILLSTLEITQGMRIFESIESISHRALACAFLSGWSGFCVHFQVIAICEDSEISFRKYFIFKGLQGIVCTLLALLVFGLKF